MMQRYRPQWKSGGQVEGGGALGSKCGVTTRGRMNRRRTCTRGTARHFIDHVGWSLSLAFVDVKGAEVGTDAPPTDDVCRGGVVCAQVQGGSRQNREWCVVRVAAYSSPQGEGIDGVLSGTGAGRYGSTISGG